MKSAPVILAVSIATLLASSVHAQLVGSGWQGDAATNDWSDAANWDTGAPSLTEPPFVRDLFFGNAWVTAGAVGFTTVNNDLVGYSGHRITFEANAATPAFTLTGNGFTLFDFSGAAPRIENQSTALQTFNLTGPLVLNGGAGGFAEINPVNGNLAFSATTLLDLAGTTQLRVFGNSGNTVTFGGAITSTGNAGANSVAINANSNVVFGGANTYTGDTFINAGSLAFAAGSSNASANLQLGDTTGTAAATLSIGDLDGGTTITGPIVVRAGSSGVKTISGANTSGTNTFSGTVTLNDATTLDVAAAGATLALTGDISGAEGLTKTGAGTVALGGTNSFAGGLSVNAGAISVAADASLGAGGSQLNLDGGALRTTASFTLGAGRSVVMGAGGGTFSPDAATALVIGQAISGAGSFTKSGAGTLNLGAANTYLGATNVTAGTLILDASNVLPGTALNVSGGALDLGANNDAVGAVTLTGGAINSTTGIFTGTGYDLQAGAVSAILAGSGAFAKNGTGTVTLTGVNTFTSTVNINGGILSVNADTALGNAANALVLDGGALNATTGFSLTRSVTLNANAGNGLGAAAGETLAVDVAMTGAGGFTKIGSGTVQLNTTPTFLGAVAVTNGVLALNTAGTAIPAAGLSITSGTAMPATVRLLVANQIDDNTPISFSANGGQSATLDLNGLTETVGDLTITTTSTGTDTGVNGVRTGAGGTLVLNGNITFNHNRNATGNTGRELLLTATGTRATTVAGGGTLDLGGVARTITVNTNHAQAASNASIDLNIVNGGIIKEGTRVLILNGSASTFTGGITINAGFVSLANSSATNTFSGGFTLNAGGTLQATAAGADSTAFNQEFGAAGNSFIFNGGTFQANYGVNDRTMTGRSFTVNAGGGTISTNGTYTNFAETNSTILRVTNAAGIFTGSGPLTKIGGGRLVLNSNSPSFSGSWTLTNGTLEALTGTARLGDGSATNTVTISGGNLATSGTYAQNFTLSGGALSGNGGNSIFNGTVDVTANSFTFHNDFFQDTGGSRSLTFNGVVSGSGGLSVAVNRGGQDFNAGSLILTNEANTYTGTITVGKNLRLQNSAADGSGKTINTAAVALASGRLVLRDNGTGSGGTLAYGNNVSLLAPTGILNNGDNAGQNTLDVNRSSGTNTGNTFQLGTLTMPGAFQLDVIGGSGYGAAFTGLTTLGGAATFNPTTAPLALLGGVDGDFSLTKIGSGLLVIGGAWNNAPTATATVNAGTLQFNSLASLPGTGANITVANGGALAAGFAIDQAFLGRIATPANSIVVALGANSANLLDFATAGLSTARLGAAGTASYTGTLTPATAGTFLLGGGGGTLVFPTANFFTGAVNLDLGTNGNVAGVTALASNDFTGSITLREGQLLRTDAGNASLGNAANSVTFDGGGVQFATGAPFDLFAVRPYTITANGAILDTNGNDYTPSVAIGNAGTGGFTKAGAGTLTVNTAVTYTGVTGVNGGVLAFADPAVFGSSASLSGNGGTLRYTGAGAATLGKAVALGTAVGALTIDVPTSTANLTSNLVISGGPGANNLALTKSGPGTLTLVTAANTFTGDVAVTGGTLAVDGQGNADPTRFGAGGKAITFTNGSTFRVTSGEFNPNTTGGTKRLVIGTGGAVFNSAGATAITLDDLDQLQGAGDVLIAAGLTSLGNNFNQGALPFTGNLTVGAGARLRTFNANPNPLGDTTGTTTVLSGGTLDIQSTGTNNEPVFIVGNGIGATTGALANTGTTSALLAGPVTLTGAASVGGTSTGTLTVTSAITGAFPLTKVGSATFALGGANGTALQTTALNLNGGTFLLNNDGGVDVLTSLNQNRLADNLPITLASSGAIELRGLNRTAAETTSETVGVITPDGQGFVRVNSLTPTFTTTTLNATLGNRVNNGVLFVDPGAVAGAVLGGSNRFVVTNAPALINGGTMVAPFYLNPTGQNFLTYGANGFADAAFTSTDLTTATASSIVNQGATAAALAAPASAFALKLGTGAVSGNTVTVGSGGLIASGTATHSANFTFNDGTQNVEGIVFVPTGVTATFTGTLSGAALTKVAGGTMTLGTAATTNYTPLANTPLNLLAGTISLPGAGNTANAYFFGATYVAPGATLSQGSIANANSIILGSLSGGGAITYGTNATGVNSLTINQAADAIFTGTLTRNSRASLNKGGAADLTLTTANIGVSDTLSVRFGELILTGGATLSAGATAGTPLQGRQGVRVSQGAAFTVDNTGTNLTDRFNLQAGNTLPFGLAGGTFNFLGNSAAASSEIINSLVNGTTVPTFEAGADVVNVQAGAGQSALIAFANSFARNAGASPLIRGTNLGGTQGAADTATVRYQAAPAAGDLAGGGGALGTTTVSILKGVIASAVVGGNDNYGLALYDAGLDATAGNTDDAGVRRLLATELMTSITDGQTQLDNVRLTAASNAITAATAINALHLAAGGSIDGAGALTINSGTILAAGGANGGIGTTTPGTLAFGTSEAIIHNVNDLTIGSTISGSGGLTKGGAGVLTLTADNLATLTGGQGVTVNGGFVSVANGTGLGPAANTLRLNNGGGLRATAPFITNRAVVLGNAGGIVDVANSGDTVTIGGAISGSLGATSAVNGLAANTGTRPMDTTVFTKTGAGTLLLTGANTFTGRTEVNAGTLLVGDGAGVGSLPADSHVAVNSGGTLGGSGSIGGSVAVNNGGTLAPGNSPGQLDTGALSFASGSTFKLELNGLTAATEYDQVNVTGSVSLTGGSFQITLAFAPTIDQDVFYVILNDGADAVSGTFAGLPQGAIFTSGGQQFQISYTADSTAGGLTGFNSVTGNDIALLATIPEPGTAVSLIGGLASLLGLQRFRRRR